MRQSFQEWIKENLWKTAFKKYPLKFFKDCVPQILFGPFFNTLSHTKGILIT